MNERIVVGIDEVGRGALAGPLVAAAVILEPNTPLPEYLKDSKKLSKKKREEIYAYILGSNIPVFLNVIDNRIIDEINIYQANRRAQRAIADAALDWISVRRPFVLTVKSYVIQIDGEDRNIYGSKDDISEEHIVGGDSTEPAIMLAACYAKVYRDNYMATIAKEYPEYNWDKNSGYAVKVHKEALTKYGITPYHRKTFRPVSIAAGGITGLDEIL